jgi:hypothetical protein
MIENETRVLLKQWVAYKTEQAKAKAQAKNIAATIRAIHGQDVDIRYLTVLYKVTCDA